MIRLKRKENRAKSAKWNLQFKTFLFLFRVWLNLYGTLKKYLANEAVLHSCNDSIQINSKNLNKFYCFIIMFYYFVGEINTFGDIREEWQQGI